MDQSTPEAAFDSAQQAVAAQDWTSLFRCLDRNDLIKICSNSIRAVAEAADPAVDAMIEESGFPVIEMRQLDQEMMESGMRLMQEARDGAPTDMQASLKHNKLVKRAEKFLDSNLRKVKKLPEFAGAVETQRRASTGGGSVSSGLFQNEFLDELLVKDNRAFGTRVTESGFVETVEFVRKRNRWLIRLMTASGGI